MSHPVSGSSKANSYSITDDREAEKIADSFAAKGDLEAAQDFIFQHNGHKATRVYHEKVLETIQRSEAELNDLDRMCKDSIPLPRDALQAEVDRLNNLRTLVPLIENQLDERALILLHRQQRAAAELNKRQDNHKAEQYSSTGHLKTAEACRIAEAAQRQHEAALQDAEDAKDHLRLARAVLETQKHEDLLIPPGLRAPEDTITEEDIGLYQEDVAAAVAEEQKTNQDYRIARRAFGRKRVAARITNGARRAAIGGAKAVIAIPAAAAGALAGGAAGLPAFPVGPAIGAFAGGAAAVAATDEAVDRLFARKPPKPPTDK